MFSHAKTKKRGVVPGRPISRRKVNRFEASAGISLPEDYVTFITEVANGSGPPWHLVPLKHWNACYWMDVPDPAAALQAPCIVTPSAQDHGQDWIASQGVEDWEARLERDEWDPMFGTIAVAEIGCGLYYSMIVNGPFRGRIFSYGDHVMAPPQFAEQETFGAWIEDYRLAAKRTQLALEQFLDEHNELDGNDEPKRKRSILASLFGRQPT